MANRAYLLNSVLQTNSYAKLIESGPENRKTWQTLDEAAYRLPLIWLCCFRQSDLMPHVVTGRRADGSQWSRGTHVPGAAASTALENLRQSLPLIETIVGDAALAQEYWQRAMQGIKDICLPWLTMYVDEVVDGDYDGFIAALSGGTDAIPYLIKFCGYDKNSLPYSFNEWSTLPSSRNSDPRKNNTLALGGGFGSDLPEDGANGAAARPGVNPAWSNSWKSFKKWVASDQQNLRLYNDQDLAYFAAHGEPMRYSKLVMQNYQPSKQTWEEVASPWFNIFARYACQDLILRGIDDQVFDVASALDAFAAIGMQAAIDIYREHFFPQRFGGRMLQQLNMSTIQHTALGIVIGCRDEGLCLARLQIHAFRSGFYRERGEQALYRFLLRILANFLNESGLPEDENSEPVLEVLLRLWRSTDAQALAEACLDVCDFQTHVLENHDAWSRIPVAVLLIFKLRKILGLESPNLVHPMLQGGLGQLPSDTAFAPQGLIGKLRERLMMLGFSERGIFEQVYDGPAKAAMLSGWPQTLIRAITPSTAIAPLPANRNKKKSAAPGIHPGWLQDWSATRERYVAGLPKNHQENLQALRAYAYGPEAAVPPGQAAVPSAPVSLERWLDQELMRYANARVFELEMRLVEESVFDVSLARSAFAAAYLEQMLSLRRHIQDTRHQNCKKLIYKMVPFVALGVVVGNAAELDVAMRLAGMLIQAHRKEYYGVGPCQYPIFNFMLRLFSDHLGKGPMFVEGKKEAAAIFNTLFGLWREPDPQKLLPLVLAACDYHTQRFVSGEANEHIEFNHGRWSRLPIEILLLFALRKMHGLENPQVDHPLMPAGFPLRLDASVQVGDDKLIAEVRLKMKQDGFDEAGVEASLNKPGFS